MKKRLYFLIPLLSLMLLCIGVLGACDGGPTEAERLQVYTVFFHDNYRGVYEKMVVEAGKTIALPAEPSRTGYEFEGWMLSGEEDATDAFDHLQPINNNLTVFAKWNKDNTVSLVTLKFYNYRTADEIVAIEKGSVFAAPETPIFGDNDIYAFVNWYTDKECTQVYDFNLEVNNDLILYAGWIQEKAYLKLDYNFTDSPAPVINAVSFGDTVSQIEAPTRDQYEFVGWYTERVGGLLFDFDTPIDSDVTLYAHWSRNAYMVTFNTNQALLEAGINLSYEVLKNASIETEAVTIENAMSLVGHDFAGWYLIITNPDSEEPLPQEYLVDLTNINDDMILYAAWTLHEYQIDFDYNYVEAPAQPESQTVKYTKLIQNPSVLGREGYLFGGWFTEPGCINQFTFDDTPVSADLTLYAKWILEDVQQEDITVIYLYDLGNGGVQHASLEVEYNGTVGNNAPQDPEIEDYIFVGWFRESTFTTRFSTTMNLTQDMTVYGKMLKKYTFEAEAVDLTDKTGQGTSTNSFEEQLLMDSTFVSGGDVSNGYFIRELYYYGAFINFVIEAEADETDAVLYIRASSESYEFFGAKPKEAGGEIYNYISDTDFKIIVNGNWDGEVPLTWLDYGGIYLPMANIEEREDLAQNKTPFENIFIISGLTLHQGRNVITLFVSNNNNHGGTFHAEAPIIDCIYLYSSCNLTMFDYKFYLRDGVNRG
jgi:uncharacterized repeat protein (TIGR02543 family)